MLVRPQHVACAIMTANDIPKHERPPCCVVCFGIVCLSVCPPARFFAVCPSRGRLRQLELCGGEMAADEFDMHLENECLNRSVKCDFCDWEGLRLYFDEPEESCPCKECVCDRCHELMPLYKMMFFECIFVTDSECSICLNSLAKPATPMLLLRETDDGRIVRSCQHVCMCITCAGTWKEHAPADQQNFFPMCRRPLWLLLLSLTNFKTISSHHHRRR